MVKIYFSDIFIWILDLHGYYLHFSFFLIVMKTLCYRKFYFIIIRMFNKQPVVLLKMELLKLKKDYR